MAHTDKEIREISGAFGCPLLPRTDPIYSEPPTVALTSRRNRVSQIEQEIQEEVDRRIREGTKDW